VTAAQRLAKTGIRRLGSAAKGFRYASVQGGRLPRAELDRIRALRIPPAWREVLIAPKAGSRIQAIGTDAAGRQQYIYSAAHGERRETLKRRRIVLFAAALPKLRAAVAAGLQGETVDRERVMACIGRVLNTCYFRSGSEVYAAENGSYGIATLRKQHVRVAGDRVYFDFPAKSGKRQERELRDPAVAAVVRELLALPGREVFKYSNGNGALVDVKRRHINQYLREIMGGNFTAKDFRTWAGSLHCANALALAGFDQAEGVAVRRRKIAGAVRHTAEMLGNTPAVCRASYIAPVVVDRFLAGETLRHPRRLRVESPKRGLSPAEKGLIRLLAGG
jgi:DNA topoisomerase-1